LKTTAAKILSTNGDRKKSKKSLSRRLQTDLDGAPHEPFNSKELLRVLTEVKNGNFTVLMPIDEVGLSGKINDTINQMITNLRETTIRNQDQAWLKSNLAKFAVMLQGQKDLNTVTKRILSELAHVLTVHYGAFYILKTNESTQTVKLKLSSTYAGPDPTNGSKEFAIGEGLVGQCALEKERILLTNIPKGYINISSGLGKAKPANLVILPVLFENKVKAVIELASLDLFSETHLDFLNQLTESIGIVLNTIEASTRTVELLEQSQSQASELKTQQEELRITNEELQGNALLLVKQNEEVEAKNRELAFQNDEKEKRAAELSVANKELAFQNDEKERRAAELSIANKELAFQNDEKERRAAELSIANKELAFQNDEREKRAAELSIANKELAFQNDEKEKRAAELIIANKEVEESRKSLERKAEQLALTSKYKSEFLANMSHELRSPLNSLLILAQQLYENGEGNLSDKQVRYAKTIHSCGDDLIQLINDILDLSKIESGIISTNISSIRISEIASYIETTYKPIAEARNLKFRIDIDDDLPVSMDTDMQRVNQILKNLLSNAFKFTEQGEVSLKIAMAKNWKPGYSTLDQAKHVVSFSVSDTGIGIPMEKQLVIFEAFQQAEGSTSRKYGGTGLGLSISQGLVELLGGTIELVSLEGQGSTFTLYLPLETSPTMAPRVSTNVLKVTKPVLSQRAEVQNYLSGISRNKSDGKEGGLLEVITEPINETGDDHSNIKSSDKVIMVVEHDLRFGKIMIEKAHENGLKAIVATTYQKVFDFLTRFSPIAITLDVNMPDTNGWKIIQMLRSDLLYSHIPFHIISGEENRIQALKQGARSFLLKPLENGLLNQLFTDMVSFSQKETRSILIVEDNEIDASQIAKMLADDTISITIAPTSRYALECIAREDYDCIILDYTLPDMSGNDLIGTISRAKKLFTPVIVYSVKDFTSIEMNNVNYNSNAHVMKEVNSIENLLTETVSQLHLNHKNLAPNKQKIIESIRNKRDLLNGKSILVVDDDVRNLFAMTTVFERFNMNVITADSGKEAINEVLANPKIEMVLMDIMMPEMDGYEATRIIRQQHKNPALPIIAVTAKAMKSDREKCLLAGASDYITKPVKTDQLLSLMRLWFCKQ